MSTGIPNAVRRTVWIFAALACWGTTHAQKIRPNLAVAEKSFQEGVDGYAGARDAKLLSESASSNFGGDVSHVADGEPDKSTLLFWDLGNEIPAGSTVQSASITLKVTNPTGDEYELFALLRDWAEGEVTWRNARSGEAWAEEGANGAADRGTTSIGSFGPVDIGTEILTLNADGIALVQQWVNDPASNHGVILLNYDKATDGVEFHARETETVGNRPKLTVVYEGGGGEGSGLSGTSQYRATWREDPATTMTIGWAQVSGNNPILCYGTTDHGRELPDPSHCAPYTGSKEVDQTYSYKGMDNRFARLTGLSPNTIYYFVIRDSEGVSERMSFKTAPSDPSAEFTFLAGGDSRENSLEPEPVSDPHRQVRRKANRMVGKLRPLFVTFNGDFTHKGSAEQVQNWFTDWQETMRDGRLIPVLPAIGDHEKMSAQFSWLEGVDLMQLFDLTNEHAYYKLTFASGLLSHFTLNSKISPDDIFMGTQADWDAQTAWFTSALGSDDAYWKVAQIHDPTRAHREGKGDRDDQYEAWAELIYQNGVNLVTEADGHLVKWTWPLRPSTDTNDPTYDDGFVRDNEKGTVYVGEGGWGALLHPCGLPREWTRACDSFNQFKLIQVHGREKLEVRTIKLDNESAVGTVSDGTPLALPSGLDVWTPSNGTGSVLSIPLSTQGNTPPTARINASATSGSAPFSVNFNASDSSDDDGSIVSYAWDFGDGNTANGVAVSHTYTTAGSYTARLTVTDDGGEAGTASIGITVTMSTGNTPPTARIGASATSGEAPLTLNYSGRNSTDSDGTIVSYAWDFGNGTTALGPSGSVTYSTAGTFTMTLTVTDDGGATDQTSITITVTSSGNVAPTASIGVSATSGDAPLTIDYSGGNSSDPDGSIVAYAWDFGNGTTANGPSGSVTYSTAGTYDLSLTVTDDVGLTGSASIQISVTAPGGNAPPTARFTATPAAGDAPLDVNFDASASSDPDGSIVAYGWRFGDGVTGSGETANHRYDRPGQYSVELTVTDNDGAEARRTATVTVTDPNTSGGTLLATLRFGVGDYDGMRDTQLHRDTPDEAYGSSGVLSAAGNPDIVTLMAWDLSQITPGSQLISAEAAVLIRNGTNDAYLLYAVKRPWVEAEATWNQFAAGQPWQSPGGTGADDRETEPMGQLSTTGQITFDDNGLSVIQKWIDEPATNHGFMIYNPTANDAIEFISREAITLAHRPLLTLRYEGGGTQQAPVAQFTAVEDPAMPGLVNFDASTSFDPDGTIVNYLWDFGDGNTGFGVTTSHVYAATQPYTVTLTVIDNEGLTTAVSTPVLTDTEDETLPEGFVLAQNYPNPFNPATRISYELPETTEVHLSVHDVIGRTVAELVTAARQAPGRYEVTFEAGDLPSGVYFYRLQAGAFTQTNTMVLME